MAPNWKPLKGSGRDERRAHAAKRRALKMRHTKAEQARDAALMKALRHTCYLRDRKRCRAFGTPLLFDTDTIAKRLELHHIVYRSAGGANTTSNCISLSHAAHKLEHEGLLEIRGDANATVHFTLFRYGFDGASRELVREWESVL